MITSPILLPAETISTPEAIPEMLERMKQIGLPLFALHGMGLSPDEAFKVTTPYLRDADFYEEFSPSPHTIYSDRGESGLHIDYLPQAEEIPVRNLARHYTPSNGGAYRGIFFEPADGFKGRLFGTDSQTVETMRLYRQDKVDTDIINPVGYTVEGGPGTMLFFRQGGRRSLMHDFVTVEYPRKLVLSTSNALYR